MVTSLKGEDLWSYVLSILAMTSERGVVYRTKRTGPSTEPGGTPYM